MMSILLVVMITLTGTTNTANWQWTSIGPDGGTILYVAPNTDGSSLIAVAPSSVWKYNGNTWTKVLDNVSGGPVYNTGQDTFCFISFYHDSTRIYVSTDGGNNWTSHWFIFSSIDGYSNVNGRYIYLATYDSLYVTNDGGITWQTHNLPSPSFTAYDVFITYSPSNPANVYLLTYYDSLGMPIGKVYKSTNYGQTWSLISDTSVLYGTTAFTIDPDNPNRLAVSIGIVNTEEGMFPGIYISNDGGITWNFIATSLMSGILYASDLVFHNGELYIASQIHSGLYKGHEISGVWYFTRLDSLRIVNDLSSEGGALFCAYSGGVLESSDWQTLNDITHGLRDVGVPPEDGIFGTYHSHIVNNKLYMIDNSLNIETIHGPVFSNVIYITSDGGNTWEKRFLNGVLGPVGVQTPINTDSIVYLSALGYEFSGGDINLHLMYRSVDGGETFTPMDGGFTPDSLNGFYDVEWISPSNPDRIIAKFITFDKTNFKFKGKDALRLYLSTDGGNSFRRILTYVVDPFRIGGGDTIALSAELNWNPMVLLSYDSGENWSYLPVQGYVSDVLFHSGNLYLSNFDITNHRVMVLRYNWQTNVFDTLVNFSPPFNAIDGRLAYGNNKIFLDIISHDFNRMHSNILAIRENSLIVDTTNYLFTAIDTVSGKLIGFTPNSSVYASTDGYVGVNEGITFSGKNPVKILYTDKGVEFFMSLSGEYSLRIFDITGRKILQGKFETKKLDIGNSLKPGVYFYNVRAGNIKTSGKFVIFK